MLAIVVCGRGSSGLETILIYRNDRQPVQGTKIVTGKVKSTVWRNRLHVLAEMRGDFEIHKPVVLSQLIGFFLEF